MKTLGLVFFLFVTTVLTRAQAPPPAGLRDPFLDNFIGNWRVERKLGSGRTIETSLRGEWVLKHHFIRLHYGNGETSPEYEAFVFIGYDDAEKTYACYWLDVYGASLAYPRPGVGKLENNALELHWDSKDGALTNKFTFYPENKSWTSLIRQTEKGEWKTFAEEKWTRR